MWTNQATLETDIPQNPIEHTWTNKSTPLNENHFLKTHKGKKVIYKCLQVHNRNSIQYTCNTTVGYSLICLQEPVLEQKVLEIRHKRKICIHTHTQI